MKRTAWAMLVVILLVGAALRVFALAQIPPGLYHDEAFSGLDALAILRGAGLPIFFEGNGGREPFFIYLHALSIFLFGPSAFALRLPAAFVGILTLAACFVLVRALNTRRRNATGLALIATAGLAVSYWHLNFSRMGWRTITLPFLACLAFYFFWRARRTGKLRDHVLTGALLGAGLYTYLSARFLPFVVVGSWIDVGQISKFVLRHSYFNVGQISKFVLRNAIVVVVAALVVFAPLAFYFLNHPQALFFRVSDVTLAGEGTPLEAIASNAWRVAQMFFQVGDPEWRHGIARRPVLDWIIGVPFALGLVVALWRWRKPASWFALLWLGIMLLPTVLSKDAPDTQRAIGALPAIYLFVAWGLEWLADFVAARRQALARYVMPAATALVLFGGGVISARDYFVVWANDRHAYYDYQGDLVGLSAWLNAQSQDVVLPVELYAQATIHFLTLPRYGVVRSMLDLTDAEKNQIAAEPKVLVSPTNPSGGAFALLRGNQVILLDPRTSVQSLADEKPWQDRWGKTLVTLAPVSSLDVTRTTSFTPLNADFDHQLRLVGYSLNRAITPGKPYPVTLAWSFSTAIQQSITVFLHVLDSNGKVVAGVDEPLVNDWHTSLLPIAQTIPDEHTFPINGAMPPGKYALEIGVYQPANDSRLPVWINGARVADDRIVIPLKVAQPALAQTPTQSLNAQFGDAISLEGLDVAAPKVKRGETFHLSLFWQARRATERDYTVFVHLLDAQSRIIAQSDRQPQNGNYPTSLWDAGERIFDEVDIAIPADAPSGPFKIEIGLYDATTGQRLPVAPASDHIVVDVAGEIVPD